VPGFDAVIGQSLPIRQLQTFISKAIIPHALLFTGKQGIGKTTTAQNFAAALNCEMIASVGPSHPTTAAIPCGQCRTCRQILNGHHPDVMVIEPKGNTLRIDQIRDLRATLAMKPFSALRRVVIIADGHCMNPEAGNALLKLLEEPPDETILIITALQLSDLLPTIVSRCQHIRFNPIPTDDIRTFLVGAAGLDPREAEQVARLSEGSLGRALRLQSRPYAQERDWLIRASGLDRPDQLAHRPVSAALAFAGQLAARKERVQELLNTLKTWVRDLNVVDYNPTEVVNEDLKEMLGKAGKSIHPEQKLHWWQTIDKAQKDIAGNANLRLTLDIMALGLCFQASGSKGPRQQWNNPRPKGLYQ
jgi:DNA polymerase-3 subunit delta'